jgi:type II secretory ATPase GspE/PulE/Tfp pilus assembly ATPase PilB-like protein
MLGIVSQRLIPILCDSCKDPVTLDAWQELGLSDEHYLGGLFARGLGCSECAGIGYTGRQIVADVVAMTDELRTILFSGNPDSERHARDAWQIKSPETMASLAYQGLVNGRYAPQDVLGALGEIAPPAKNQSESVRFAYKNTMRER